jgi:hypothetical protein
MTPILVGSGEQRMRYVVTAILFVLCVCANAAHGEGITGRQLLTFCSAPKLTPSEAICLGFLSGMLQMQVVYSAWTFHALKSHGVMDPPKWETDMFCLPNVSVNKIKEIVVNYLQGHTGDLDDPAITTLTDGFVKRYSCLSKD